MYGLKFFAKLHGAKYEWIGRKIGVGGENKKTTINTWISRKSIPNVEHIEALAKLFGARSEYINRILTTEEMKRLEFEFIYKRHDWQEVTYVDEDGIEKTELMWGETEESKYAEEEFYNEQADEIVLKDVKSFLDQLCSSNEKGYARQILSQVINVAECDDPIRSMRSMSMVSRILGAVEEVLIKEPNVLDKINFEIQIPNEFIDSIKNKATIQEGFITQADGSIAIYKDGVKTVHK